MIPLPSFPSISPFAPPSLTLCVSSCGAEVQTKFLWAKSGCLDWAVCQSGPSNLWYRNLRNFSPLTLFTSPILCYPLPGFSRGLFYQIRLKTSWEIKWRGIPLLMVDKRSGNTWSCIGLRKGRHIYTMATVCEWIVSHTLAALTTDVTSNAYQKVIFYWLSTDIQTN